MKKLLNYIIALFLILHFYSSEVLALETESILNKSQLIITNKYAERYCNATENNFFEGLDNERILKYSYFKYIGFQNEEIYSNDLYKHLIIQIRERCLISNEEEREINEYFIDNISKIQNKRKIIHKSSSK